MSRGLMHDDHLRAKAIELRTKHRLTLGAICERLSLSKTTVYYWIKELPVPRKDLQYGEARTEKIAASRQHVYEGNALRAKEKQDAAYQEGLAMYPELIQIPTFREFVTTYLCEGMRRSRNKVELCNSNPAIVKLGHHWIRYLTEHKLYYQVQFHIDNDEQEIKDFWANQLSISADSIAIQRKSNSDELSGRQWRSVHGVLSVSAADTYLRSRLHRAIAS